MNVKLKILALSLLGLSLTGCALHAPLSEEIIFDDELEETTDFNSIFRSSKVRVSLTKSYYSKTFESLNRERYAVNVDTTLNPFWQIGVAGYSFLLVFGDKFSIGLNPSLLVNAGADFTYEISSNLYITGLGNLTKNAELILQTKIFDGKYFKGSFGFNYRHERQGYINFFSMDKTEPFDVNLIGIRGVLYFPLMRNNHRLQLGLAYDMKYKTPVFNIGFSNTFGF
ncbi:MAG: hypothetical protein HND52_17225 [Ignavibacteriae bacterium]|nr:hypothetical protein [Ignavibacteriota bacterium]NOG99704.1 hypothetical protein [Ignavibacteriota bacterium]